MAAAKKNKGTVGVIGLGIMGGAFARNLSKAGWRVIGFDLSAARCREVARAGVHIAKSAAEVARAAPVILTSLPKPQALAATARAIAAAKLPRKTVVEMSTFAIEDKEKAEKVLRKAGHTMLDVPVSGTGAQAATRDLVFYASGDPSAVKRLRPMFEVFGRHVYDVGKFGNGSKMKYVANLLVAIHNVASAEAMVLGMKAGLAPQLIFDLIKSGAGNSRIFELRGPDDGQGQVRQSNHEDRCLGQGHARDRRLRQKDPRADADVRRLQADLCQAQKSGYGGEDTAAVCAVLETMANFKRRR